MRAQRTPTAGPTRRAAIPLLAATSAAVLSHPATAQTGAAANAAGSAGWERVVYGIEVLDEAGVLVDPPIPRWLQPSAAPARRRRRGRRPRSLHSGGVRSRSCTSATSERGPRSEYRWITDTFENLSVGEWFRFTDVDLDGDLDLLAEEPFSYIRYYRNDGGSGPASYVLAADTLKDVNGEAVFSDRQNIPNAADIDCDGYLDLLIGRLTGHDHAVRGRDHRRERRAPVPARHRLLRGHRDHRCHAGQHARREHHGARRLRPGRRPRSVLGATFSSLGSSSSRTRGAAAVPCCGARRDPSRWAIRWRPSGYNAPALGRRGPGRRHGPDHGRAGRRLQSQPQQRREPVPVRAERRR